MRATTKTVNPQIPCTWISWSAYVPSPEDTENPRFALSRRGLVVGGAAAAGAFLGGLATGDVAGQSRAAAVAMTATKDAREPFFGQHQSGILTGKQASGSFSAYTLKPESTLESARRLMTLLTDDAARLCKGEPALPDNDPELAELGPARLTVTFGFGPGFFTKLGLGGKMPAGFADLPAYTIDQLEPRWSGGDLLIQVGSDDPIVTSHAARQLLRTARSFTSARWVQHGFMTSPGTGSGTSRNLMGQVDGTVNPRTTAEQVAQVWASGSPAWFEGGTCMVVRRIAMNLETWDVLDEGGKELAMGRRLATGAPLTGTHEFDTPDLSAKDASGKTVIPNYAHIRRAAATHEGEKFLRRPWNYDEGLLSDGSADAGLIFAAYMANIEKQYLPVQQRLADLDLMNMWTTPIGSAVFALPPGTQPGGYIGEGLLS